MARFPSCAPNEPPLSSLARRRHCAHTHSHREWFGWKRTHCPSSCVTDRKRAKMTSFWSLFSPGRNYPVKTDEDGINHLENAWLSVFFFIFTFASPFSFLMENREDRTWPCPPFLMGESTGFLSHGPLTATARPKSVRVLPSKFVPL